MYVIFGILGVGVLGEHADLACIMQTWLGEAEGVLCPAAEQTWGGEIAVVDRDPIPLTRSPVSQCAGFECVGAQNRIVSHPELTE